MLSLRGLEVKERKLSKVFLILVMMLLPISLLQAQERLDDKQFDTDPMHWGRFWARGLFDRNLIWCPVWNIGCTSDSRVEIQSNYMMRWPGAASRHSYIEYGIFLIGAKVPNMKGYESTIITDEIYNSIDQPEGYPDEVPIVTNSFLPHISTSGVPQVSSDRTHQQIWAPTPGFFNHGKYGWVWGINEDTNRDGQLSPAEDVNYNGEWDLNLDPPESIINQMAISTDKRTWPEYWPGGSYIGDDRPYYGRPPRTTRAGERAGYWNGEYKIATIADQETFYRMDDHENDKANDFYGSTQKYYPMKNGDGTPDTTTWHDGGMAGAGIEVEVRSYAWFHPLAEDLLVSIYRLRNYSDYTLNRIVTAMYADVRVGPSINNLTDFIPATYDYTGEGGRLDFDILYQWQEFPEDYEKLQKLGTFAFAFLESPGISYNGVDDDADFMVDESMVDGIDNDGDWEPYADYGLDRIGPMDENYEGPDKDGTEGNGIWDTEDTNFNGALDPREDINKNSKLDMEDPRDDRGTDGVGPDENGWPGPDKDGSECNSRMDLGEPNFDLTDIDEQDQAGLKHVYVKEENQNYLLSQQNFWDLFLEKDNYDDPDIDETDEGIFFVFGARNVMLFKQMAPMEFRRFAIALVMGEDADDAVRNKATMQNIYNENYRFLTPPLQPTLIANVGDERVQLYWDSDAEDSKDPFFGKDFNGYRLYKSTDPIFLDVKTVTDAFGNVLLYEPIAIFDKQDLLVGAHPIPFPNLGVHYDMGDDTGLRHSYRDTLVDNGRTYYYALTAIDAGNDDGWAARGLVEFDYPMKAMPSESPFNITVNILGEVIYRDRNTAVAIPSEPAAGYTDTYVDTLNVNHIGDARPEDRSWRIGVFNRHHVNVGHEYEVTFTDDHWMDEITLDYYGGRTTSITCKNVTTGDTLFTVPKEIQEPLDLIEYGYPELERSVLEGLHFGFKWPLISGDRDRGMEIVKVDKKGRSTNVWKKWVTDTKTNLRVEDVGISKALSAYPLPIDVEIRVEDYVGVDTSIVSNPILQKAYPINFTTWDITDPDNPKRLKVFMSYDKTPGVSPPEMYGQIWDSSRVILAYRNREFVEKGKRPWAESWGIRFFKNKFDTLNPVIPPAPGDIFHIKTFRNPTRLDTLRFVVAGGDWSKDLANERTRDIFVVPDPYVVSNNFEPWFDLAGNNQRRVDFVNLPPQCTIRIFTASGRLVKKLDHQSVEEYGRHSWDLTTEDGPEVAFGMYFFVVEAPGLDTRRGKFAVIK